jgi:hypothetical protein
MQPGWIRQYSSRYEGASNVNAGEPVTKCNEKHIRRTSLALCLYASEVQVAHELHITSTRQPTPNSRDASRTYAQHINISSPAHAPETRRVRSMQDGTHRVEERQQ